MLVLKERIINVPIMSLQTGSEIARTGQPIIDPRHLSIVAFYCEGPRLDINPAVLHISDIREVSSLGFIVDSADRLMPPDDLVRLQEIIKYDFTLEDKLVVDDAGHKMGKVANYTVNPNSFYISQLKVTPHFWKALTTTELLISRTQIIEITDSTIVVKAPRIKEQAKVKSPAAPRPIIENPFRKPQPRPEAAPAKKEVTTSE